MLSLWKVHQGQGRRDEQTGAPSAGDNQSPGGDSSQPVLSWTSLSTTSTRGTKQRKVCHSGFYLSFRQEKVSFSCQTCQRTCIDNNMITQLTKS